MERTYMPPIRHFNGEKFTPHHYWISDEAYSQILDNVVIVCVDIILCNAQGEILLGKRQQEPMRDWWIIGGRMRAGESLEEAVQRNIKRELGFEADLSTLWQVGVYSMIWATRAQPPQNRGCHVMSITHGLMVEPQEFKFNEEYKDVRWINPKTVTIQNGYHPYLVQIVKDWSNELPTH